MTKISGNYDGYQKVLDDRRKHLLKKFKEQEKKREQLKVFISRFHAQPNKASQVRAKKKTLEKMEEIVVPENRRESIRRFHFPEARQSGYRVIKLDKISKSYPSIQVYKDFSFEIIRGEKAVLAGANGAGKSTLLKILAGVIDIDEGVRSLGHNVDIGYFSQTRMEVLSPHNTVFEEAYTVSGGTLSQEAIRTILAAFLFTGEDVDKKITILSGGEKSRLILAKLLIKPPNFLLLDEPTTHLDIDAVDALIKALTQYQGTVIFISHDIHFVRSIANVVYEVKSGTVRKFPGNFDYYWQRVKDENFSNGIPKALPEKVWEKLGTKPQLEKDSSRTLPAKGNPKEHNVDLAKKIKKIRKQKEKMELERNVKLRILSNPRGHHSQEMVREYSRRLEELNKIITQAEEEITKLKQLFIPSE
jgi:ATP-binding cassette subfamily F protein 3